MFGRGRELEDAFPDIYFRICVTCLAECFCVSMPASIAPDIIDSTIPAECLITAITDDNGLIFFTYIT